MRRRFVFSIANSPMILQEHACPPMAGANELETVSAESGWSGPESVRRTRSELLIPPQRSLDRSGYELSKYLRSLRRAQAREDRVHPVDCPVQLCKSGNTLKSHVKELIGDTRITSLQKGKCNIVHCDSSRALARGRTVMSVAVEDKICTMPIDHLDQP